MAASKWKDVYIFRAYDLARSGLKDLKIAGILGINASTLTDWKGRKKLFRMALKKGRKGFRRAGEASPTFSNYVYQRLSKPMKEAWDRINALDEKKAGVEKIEQILDAGGKTMRQHLFLYSWTVNNFSLSVALRQVNISRSTFENWKKHDSDFADLVDEINWHKKNFFEDHLSNLIADGDTSATIFANRTINRDRGYNEKVEMDVKGSVDVNTLDVDTLDLSIEVRKALLEAMRKREVGKDADKRE